MTTTIDPIARRVRAAERLDLTTRTSGEYKGRTRDSSPRDLLSGPLRVRRMSVHVYPADDRVVKAIDVPAA
jgi:hypothetical protein